MGDTAAPPPKASTSLSRPPSLQLALPEKSSFASRQPSEESKNLRFEGLKDIHDETAEKKHRRTSKMHHIARRMSRPIALGEIKGLKMRGHLNYKEIRERFERQSTFHGISHAALAPTPKWRWFWYLAFLCCLAFLLFQIILLIIKYRMYAKTVDLDLKFENAPFPSITLCNLNPYKKSAIYNNPNTKKMMETFDKLVQKGDQSDGVASILSGGNSHLRVKRARRPKGKKRLPRRYHQVFAQCICDVDPGNGERKGSCLAANIGKVSVEVENDRSRRTLQEGKCLCQLDTVSKTLWPCFPYNSWKEKLCTECVDGTGHCPTRFYTGSQRYNEIQEQVDVCLCHRDYNHCVRNNDDGIIPSIDPTGDVANFNVTTQIESMLRKLENAPTTTTTTEAPEVIQALGFEEVTDDIAIATQAQQNLIFAVGEMNATSKVQMSHSKDEFILKCSFNQKDCNIEDDFKLHYDNTYGNCYTFNWNRTAHVSAQRAGANYGLRVMLYADVNEYLPTSEATGFRITVHDKWIVPFPDAFGYSAPTGFLSSFGVRMKQFLRITAPHGHCLDGGEESPDFVYAGFNYSVEACHRSCTQKEIISRCGCADPMYPVPRSRNVKTCPVTDAQARDCIRNTTHDLVHKIAHGSIEDCPCHQPCVETNYEVTYSAARWPSGAAKVMECPAGDHLCLEKYRKNAAMVQIFYEELNYETMQETPAYTFTSALADLGGLTGLWIGASVVSLLEIVSLIVFAMQAYVREKKRKMSNASSKEPSLVVNPTRYSRTSLHTLHKTSTKLSIQRSFDSSHTSRSKSRSKLSMNMEDLPVHVEESEAHQSSDESEHTSVRTNGSCRYIAPGEDLPCLCTYNNQGYITTMKALCPVHGYMVRRQYDYSLSNSEEGEEDEEETDEYRKPSRMSTISDRMKNAAKRMSRLSRSSGADVLEGEPLGEEAGPAKENEVNEEKEAAGAEQEEFLP